MALEAVVFQQDPVGYNGSRDLYTTLLVGHGWREEESYDQGLGDFLGSQTESNVLFGDNCSFSPPSSMASNWNELLQNSNLSSETVNGSRKLPGEISPEIRPTRRRRSKSRKNKEEIENQRMTHIAVERNRRKLMNEYLSVLRSLMPDSYVQRGDQASIIGGAINFVKELEQKVHFLSSQTATTKLENSTEENDPSMPFSEFFSFPQYSTTSPLSSPPSAIAEQTKTPIADIEVNMVESHANIKIRSKRKPKQLLNIVAGLQSLHLTVLHLNLTTLDQIILYSLSVKVEDGCKLCTADEIAAALYELMSGIQEEGNSLFS